MEDFVSFEIAKKLKEKGFREECLCHYIGNDLFYNIESPVANKQLWFSHNKLDNVWHRDNYDAPTISQVLMWFRKEKDIHLEPCILADADTDADGKVIYEYTYWSFSIQSIETGDMIYFEYEHIDDKRFNSYEQAAIAGIEYIIDNMI